MCLDCGHYNGRKVVDLAEKKKARTERMEAKKEAIRSQAGLPEAPEPKETKESK